MLRKRAPCRHYHVSKLVTPLRPKVAASPNKPSPAIASVDLDECIARLYKKELLAESVIEAVCAKTKELLMRESNVVHVKAPITVVGDIHGQFYDLIEIFKIGGYCPDTNYLFLGPSPPDACLDMLRGLYKIVALTKFASQATTLIVACSASRRYRCSSA